MTYFSESSWSEFCVREGFDARLSKAIPKLKIEKPTTVQEMACPAIISGKDVLIKSPTGTGKTLAYILPLIQRLVSSGTAVKPMSMVVLVPTKELCGQVFAVCTSLLHYLFDVISVDNYTGEEKYRRPSLPSVLITTPRGLVSITKAQGALMKDNIRFIAVDEADLVLSHGFEKDIRTIVSTVLPKDYQAVLVSATLTDDLDTLKGLMLRNPVSVVVEDKDISSLETPKVAKKSSSALSGPTVQQLYFPSPAADKFLCLYALLKLEVISGRMLIFTSSVDAAYRLKIFFDKFAIASAVFNSEMPLECRHRVLSAFNDNLFKILIASDEAKASDPETAAHRGIDFSNVNVVINMDLPSTVANYVHRAGRTARGGKSGIVLSFVDPKNQREQAMFEKICEKRQLRDMEIPVKAFEPLRYRVEDVYKGISRRAIAAARQKELLNEIMHNEQLKQKLSENSDDVQALRQAMRTLREHTKIKWHLRELPEYLLPDLSYVKPLTGNTNVDVIAKLKRKRRYEDYQNAVQRPKRTLRDKLVYKDSLTEDASPEDLVPLSGRKIWKMKHHKSTKRNGDTTGKPPRVARKLWKSAKKFT
jgi:ATP-dependent RNA helicase DDX56/DBP9